MQVIAFDIETTGLDPVGELKEEEITDEARITCICSYDSKGEERVFFDHDEKKLIGDFLDYVNEHDEAVWTGYNIIDFDIPFIFFRAIKYNLLRKGHHFHRLRWGVHKWHNPYVVDVALVFDKGWKKHRKCQLVLKHLGLATKTADGSEAITMWEDKRYDELIQYCLNDARVEYLLFEVCEELGLLPPYR